MPYNHPIWCQSYVVSNSSFPVPSFCSYCWQQVPCRRASTYIPTNLRRLSRNSRRTTSTVIPRRFGRATSAFLLMASSGHQRNGSWPRPRRFRPVSSGGSRRSQIRRTPVSVDGVPMLAVHPARDNQKPWEGFDEHQRSDGCVPGPGTQIRYRTPRSPTATCRCHAYSGTG